MYQVIRKRFPFEINSRYLSIDLFVEMKSIILQLCLPLRPGGKSNPHPSRPRRPICLCRRSSPCPHRGKSHRRAPSRRSLWWFRGVPPLRKDWCPRGGRTRGRAADRGWLSNGWTLGGEFPGWRCCRCWTPSLCSERSPSLRRWGNLPKAILTFGSERLALLQVLIDVLYLNYPRTVQSLLEYQTIDIIYLYLYIPLKSNNISILSLSFSIIHK